MNIVGFDLVYTFLLLRCYKLLKQCPNENKKQFEVVVKNLREYIEKWMLMDNHQIRIFMAQLMMGATRAFEGYDYYYDPDKKFYFKHDPCQDILQSTQIIKAFLKKPPLLTPFSKTYMFNTIKNILKKDRAKAIISIICDTEITDEIIDLYFNQTTFLEFTHDSKELDGLSSYHGGITYINKNCPCGNHSQLQYMNLLIISQDFQ